MCSILFGNSLSRWQVIIIFILFIIFIRFLPPKLANEYGLIIPSYPAAEQIVRLSPQHNVDTTGWTLQVTEEGYPYYYNPITNQSLWAKFEQPAARNEKDNISVILSTASSMEEAKSIAAHLVRKKMVACVNIVPSITSIYEWEGKIEESTEVQMIIKVLVR